MSEQRRFGESDHEPLKQDDILAQAIGEWRDELPSRDLWQGVSARIEFGSRLRSPQAGASLLRCRSWLGRFAPDRGGIGPDVDGGARHL